MQDVNIETKETDLNYVTGVYDFGFALPEEDALRALKYILTDVTDIKCRYLRLGFHLDEFWCNKYYQQFGFMDFYEFCEKNIGLGQPAVSRCMNVYYEFSCCRIESIYHDGVKIKPAKFEIRPEYKNYSYAQLCEMLPLDPIVRKKILPDMTIKEIREFKKNLRKKDVVSELDQVIDLIDRSKEDSGSEKVEKKFDIEKYESLKGAAAQSYIKSLDSTDTMLLIFDENGKEVGLIPCCGLLAFWNGDYYLRIEREFLKRLKIE